MDSSNTPNEPAVPHVEAGAPINKRPWSVTLLAVGVLIITIINLIRMVLTIRDWSFLSTRAGISPIYLALTGLIWSVAGLFLLWGLWKAKKWAPKLMQAVGLTYALYYWLDHIFLMDHPVISTTDAIRATLLSFSAGVTVVSLVFMAWVVGRAKVKAYFGVGEAETGQNQTDKDEQG